MADEADKIETEPELPLESTRQRHVREEIGKMAAETRRIINLDLHERIEKARAEKDFNTSGALSVMADTLSDVSDLDMVDLSRCWLSPADFRLWDGALKIAGTGVATSMHDVVQCYIDVRGGLPTEAEVLEERHRREEAKVTADIERLDEEFRWGGYTQPGERSVPTIADIEVPEK